jgi:hypothetical protein
MHTRVRERGLTPSVRDVRNCAILLQYKVHLVINDTLMNRCPSQPDLRAVLIEVLSINAMEVYLEQILEPTWKGDAHLKVGSSCHHDSAEHLY